MTNEISNHIEKMYNDLCSHDQRKVCGTIRIYIRKCACARSQILIALGRQRQVSEIRCISFFSVGLYLLSHCSTGTSKIVLRADIVVVITLRDIRHWKMSAPAPIHVLVNFSIEIMCLIYY